MPIIIGTASQLALPDGWTGRFRVGGDRGGLPIFQAGNFALPEGDDDLGGLTQLALAPGGIYVNIIEYSAPIDTGLWPETAFPLRLTGDDVRGLIGGYEGSQTAAHARMSFRTGVRRFVVDVSFGDAVPSPSALALAAEVVRGLILVGVPLGIPNG